MNNMKEKYPCFIEIQQLNGDQKFVNVCNISSVSRNVETFTITMNNLEMMVIDSNNKINKKFLNFIKTNTLSEEFV